MKLIDADALKERLKEYCIDGDEQAMQWYDIMGIDEAIDNAPTIDAVPVVRCKDCIYYDNLCRCDLLGIPMERLNFCSYGERRDDETI